MTSTNTRPPDEAATADGNTTRELAELARNQARKALQKIPMLGAVTWLMLQQPPSRSALVGDIEWRVLPPLMLGQARLFMKGEAPVGYASWALVSDEAATRWRLPPHRLAFQDWNSGAQAWLVDLVAPFGGAKDMLEELRTTHLAGRELMQLAPVPNRPAEAVRWPAQTAGFQP